MRTMKKILFPALMAILLTGCQTSLDDQAERECKEYTKKHCPQEDGLTILDSMSFTRSTRTIGYHYQIKGNDPYDPELFRQKLLEALDNQTAIRSYKEAGFAFRYVFLSAEKPDSVILDVTFTQEDYQQGRH